MKIMLEDARSLGQVVRAVRKAQNLRQDDTAGSLGSGRFSTAIPGSAMDGRMR